MPWVVVSNAAAPGPVTRSKSVVPPVIIAVSPAIGAVPAPGSVASVQLAPLVHSAELPFQV